MEGMEGLAEMMGGQLRGMRGPPSDSAVPDR
jgi:hypothetical protein